MKQIKLCILFFFFLNITPRSVQRLEDNSIPTIVFHSEDQGSYILAYRHLSPKAFFFTFDYAYLQQHRLPKGEISYRHANGSIMGAYLSELIEHLLYEIKNKKTNNFRDFIVLKQRDFNKKEKTGLIIVKAKKYPFVVKLFIETPRSMALPLSKGFEPTCFFFIGKGANRHLTGFTRIKNREDICSAIAHSPWKDEVDPPRKWFWMPKDEYWIYMEGHNMSYNNEIISMSIPGIYAIVCDYIDIERTFSLTNPDDCKKALDFSNFLHQAVDPHINNYVTEKKHTPFDTDIDKSTRHDTDAYKSAPREIQSSREDFVPLDTEHFPTMVGIENPETCKSYLQWYMHLSFKMLIDCLFTTKKQYRIKQNNYRLCTATHQGSYRLRPATQSILHTSPVL